MIDQSRLLPAALSAWAPADPAREQLFFILGSLGWGLLLGILIFAVVKAARSPKGTANAVTRRRYKPPKKNRR